MQTQAQIFEPYFYGFQDHDGFVTVKVEIETIEKLLYCELSVTYDDLLNGMDNARMFDLRDGDTHAVTADVNGVYHRFDCITWASLETDEVFQAIHKVEPFQFLNIQTRPV